MRRARRIKSIRDMMRREEAWKGVRAMTGMMGSRGSVRLGVKARM